MRVRTVRLKSVIGAAVMLSALSGAAMARRNIEQADRTRPLLRLVPSVYANTPLRQHDGHSAGTASSRLQLAIDGATNPNAITDERAYDHFLSAVASLQSAKGLEVVLRGVGLTATDRRAFIAAMGSLNAELKMLTEQRKANRTSPAQAIAAQRLLLDDARIHVRHSLSTVGREQLDRHIRQDVKLRVKVYRAPMPSQPAEALQ